MINTLSSNYYCLEHIFMVPKVFEPLKLLCFYVTTLPTPPSRGFIGTLFSDCTRVSAMIPKDRKIYKFHLRRSRVVRAARRQKVAVRCEFEAGLRHATTGKLSVNPAVKLDTFRIREGYGSEKRGMDSAFHQLCPGYCGTLTPLPLRLSGYGKPLPSQRAPSGAKMTSYRRRCQYDVIFTTCARCFYDNVRTDLYGRHTAQQQLQ